MSPSSIARRGFPTCAGLAFVAILGGVAPAQDSSSEEPAAPKRIRLFDLMPVAEVTGLAERDAEEAEITTRTLGFEADQETSLWFGRPRGRQIRFDEEMGGIMSLTSEGGLVGGALKLGPKIDVENGFATFYVFVEPMTRCTIRGRVKLVDNPIRGEASSREVIQVRELSRRVDNPSYRRGRFGWTRFPTHRVSRTLDPSGWDHFEVSFVTRLQTRSLEIRLLHPSGGSEEAKTFFDEITLEEQKASEAEVYDFVSARYTPRDGQEAQTPWRLRVPLGREEFRREEHRDAILLPPPARWTTPLEIPDASTQPILRFYYGMLPDAFDMSGDGARIAVNFHRASGERIEVGSLEFDPKGNSEHRQWGEAHFDLTPVAGQKGKLEFAVDDIADDDDQDLMDAVVIATPRIEPKEEVPSGLNVFLIGVDTLRADRMSAFGYERETTPHLSELADEAVRFTQTRSPAPWTLPSFSTVLTSLYPSAHGAGRGGHDEWTPIDPTTKSLPEILARLGYETQGITANHLISPSYGLDQGFEAYRIPGRRGWSMESVDIDTDGVLDYLEERVHTPFFLFWHIMDPHLPYTTEDSYREEFTDTEYSGRFTRRGHNVPFGALDPRPGRRWYTHEGPPPPPDLTEADRAFVHDYYDAEIAEVDAAIGRVLDKMKELGLYERTVIAFVADHGEGLGDHNHYHHGYTLYDDQVHIPMILRIPGEHEGETITRPVGSIDLAPTIMGALGLTPPDHFQGQDRLREGAPDDDPVILEYPTYDSSAMKAYILGDYKYLHDPVFHTQALYNIRKDPGEKTDILAEHPEFVAQAREALDTFRWEQLQKGRFHIRVQGKRGQSLRLKVRTDDLFDANFASSPKVDEHDFTMDLDRSYLTLETELTKGRMELVFWCRGRNLDFEITLDGVPLANGMTLGPDGEVVSLPANLARASIPVHESDKVGAPGRDRAMIWLEAGASQVMPVVPTPEEIEMLRQLGYAR